MKRKQAFNSLALLLMMLVLWWLGGPAACSPDVSPAAVGWGNLLVPGFGATLRGEPARGLLEAGAEIGLFYGGTFGVREGEFTIDSTIVVPPDPRTGRLLGPLIGQGLQQFGLKLHFYDTFYNYQKVCLSMEDSEREKSNGQPLYKGDWWDVMSAPFRWKNLSNPWVYTAILVSTALLFYQYNTTTVTPQHHATNAEESMYALNNVAIIPLGSAFGEEPLFAVSSSEKPAFTRDRSRYRYWRRPRCSRRYTQARKRCPPFSAGCTSAFSLIISTAISSRVSPFISGPIPSAASGLFRLPRRAGQERTFCASHRGEVYDSTLRAMGGRASLPRPRS